MKGIQHIEVSNRKVKFKLDLIRNITIIRGESGTGKTTLYNMISDYCHLPKAEPEPYCPETARSFHIPYDYPPTY